MVDVFRQIPKGPNNESLWRWDIEYAKGLMKGYRQDEIVAISDRQTSADEIRVIGDEDGAVGYPDTASTLSVVSTSADDSESNTGPNRGARRIRITGITADFSAVSETVQLNGTTPVITTTEFLRVNQMRATLVSVDEELAPAGTITATHTGGGGVLNKMRPLYNRENFATFFTRRQTKHLLWSLFVSVGRSDEFQIQVQTKQPAGSGWRTEGIFQVYETAVQLSPTLWIGSIDAGRDVRIVAQNTTTGSGTISALMEFMRIEAATGV